MALLCLSVSQALAIEEDPLSNTLSGKCREVNWDKVLKVKILGSI